MSGDDKCQLCGCDRADHDYVKNTVDSFSCPQSKRDRKAGKVQENLTLFRAEKPTVYFDDFRF